MEIFLFSRPDIEHSKPELEHLITQLNRHLPQYKVNREFARILTKTTGFDMPEEKQYDMAERTQESSIAISYGGDGTFLDCARMVGFSGIPLLGINSGRLGFLANTPKEGIEQAFEDIANGRFETERRTLIHASGDFPNMPQYPFAFNEFSLQRGGAGMIAVETYVDKEMVATYWGDGALISTPSGSTAYSLSVGGPVLAPGCDCLVISPIAPHNLTMRPVVIPNDCKVTMKVLSRHENPYATLDNMTFVVENGAEFTLEKAKNFTFLVKLQNISFYDTLRNKMLWGIDHRTQLK